MSPFEAIVSEILHYLEFINWQFSKHGGAGPLSPKTIQAGARLIGVNITSFSVYTNCFPVNF